MPRGRDRRVPARGRQVVGVRDISRSRVKGGQRAIGGVGKAKGGKFTDDRFSAINRVHKAARVGCALRGIGDVGRQASLAAERLFGTGRHIKDETSLAARDVERGIPALDNGIVHPDERR